MACIVTLKSKLLELSLNAGCQIIDEFARNESRRLVHVPRIQNTFSNLPGSELGLVLKSHAISINRPMDITRVEDYERVLVAVGCYLVYS